MMIASRGGGTFLWTLAVATAFLVLPHRGIGQILVNGGNVTLSITTGTAVSEPAPVVDATTTTIDHDGRKRVTKITVSTVCPSQKFTLKVLATGDSAGGIAAPEVTLVDGMPAMDFVTDIPRGKKGNGTVTVQYTASATYADGNSVDLGDDVHTVTYTLLNQ